MKGRDYMNQRILMALARGPLTNIQLRERLEMKERDLCLAIGQLLLQGYITARMEPGRRVIITYRTAHTSLREAA